MTGILITGGENPGADHLRSLLSRDTLLGAADAGIHWALDNGFSPDFVTGDMDSLPDPGILDSLPEEKIYRYPAEKDDSDTELGLKILKERGCTRLIVWGGGGGRMDHFLAIAALFDREDGPDEWFTRYEHFQKITERAVLSGREGRRVSLFPLGGEECRMTSTGLQWPLDRLAWRKGDFGLSNRIVKKEMIIQIKQGRLLMITDWREADRP